MRGEVDIFTRYGNGGAERQGKGGAFEAISAENITGYRSYHFIGFLTTQESSRVAKRFSPYLSDHPISLLNPQSVSCNDTSRRFSASNL